MLAFACAQAGAQPAPAPTPSSPAPASAPAPPSPAAPVAAPAPAPVPVPVATRFDLRRPEIVAFVNAVVRQDGLSRRQVQHLLKQAQPQPKIIEIMNRPIEKVAPWWEYRDHFLTAERIADGVQFWTDHRLALEQAASTYQVPAEYIVAILETTSTIV